MKNSKVLFKISLIASTILIIALLASLFFMDFSMSSNMTINIISDFEGNSANVNAYEGDSDYTAVIVTENETDQTRIKSLVRFFYDQNINIISLPIDKVGLTSLETFMSKATDPSAIDGGIARDKTILIGYGIAANKLLDYISEYGQGYMGLVLFAPHDFPSPITHETLDIRTLILGTTSDDIASPEVLTGIYNTLSGSDIRGTGFAFTSTSNMARLHVSSNAFSVYNVYSNEVIRGLSQWLNNYFGIAPEVNSTTPTMRVYSWLLVVISLIVALISAYNISVRSVFNTSYSLVSGKDIFPPVYFTLKGLLLLGTVPISIIIIAILWFTPLKAFILPLCFGVYLAINAVGMYLIYHYSKLPVFDETNRFIAPRLNPKRFIKAICLSLFVVATTLFLSYSGVFGLSFLSPRIFIFVMLLILTGAGFYTAFYENLFLTEMKAHFVIKAVFQMVSYIPLVALAIISIPIAGFTTLLTCIIYILGLYVAILLHRTVSHLTVNPLITSIIIATIYSGFLAFVVI